MRYKYFLCFGLLFFMPFFLIQIFSLFFHSINNKHTSSSKTITVKYSPSPSPKLSPITRSFKIRAAIPYWDQEKAAQSFYENIDSINVISLFWYYLDNNGKIKKYEYANEDSSIIDQAHKNNIQVSAVLTNLPEGEDWSSKVVENVIDNDIKMNEHIKEIEDLLVAMHFDGITIDYESVDASQEKQFTAFIDKLSNRLHKKNKYVEVALHPKKGVSADSRYRFQNWKDIAKSADRIYIMAYDEHENESNAGPVAGINWVGQILSYADKQDIDKSKLLLGIPLDGYDWNHDNDDPADGVTYEEVINLISQYKVTEKYDQKSASPYFTYTSSGENHEVWYENAKSVGEKIYLARKLGLGGVTFWRLGGEDQNIWNDIKNLKY